MPTYLDPDPQQQKKPQFGAALPGTMVNSTGPQQGPGASANNTDPGYALGNPNAAPPPVGGTLPGEGTVQESPGYQDTTNRFPSLPPGATPPPGYVDPITGARAGAPPQPAPAAPAAAPAPGAPAPVGGSADFPSLPPGATPPPGYVDPITGKVAGGGAAPAAPAAPPGAPAQAPPPPSPGMPAPGTPGAPSAPPTTVNDAYKKALIDGLTRGAPTMDSPEVKAQTDAYAVQQQRARERSQEALAEQQMRSGGLSDNASSGAFNAGTAGLIQQQGENQAGFNARTLGSAMEQQRDELLRYAALAGNDLNAEEARDLQERIATLNADIERSRIEQTGDLGEKDLDLRRYGIDTQGKLGEGDLNLRLLLGLLGNQFNQDRLGADVGMFNAGRDDSNFWRMLGGI